MRSGAGPADPYWSHRPRATDAAPPSRCDCCPPHGRGYETPTDHTFGSPDVATLRAHARDRGEEECAARQRATANAPRFYDERRGHAARSRADSLAIRGCLSPERARRARQHLRFATTGLYIWIAGAKNDPRRAGHQVYVPRLAAERAELWAVGARARPRIRGFGGLDDLSYVRPARPSDGKQTRSLRCYARLAPARSRRRRRRFVGIPCGAATSRTRRRRRS